MDHPQHQKNLPILRVSVRDDGIHWDLQQPDDVGMYESTASDDGHPLPFDKYRQAEETIRRLVDMQRWLWNLLADRQLKLEKEPELVERLTDMAKVVGQHLYTLLFKDPIHECLLDALIEDKRPELLRIELEFSGMRESQLRAWPWEYLYMPLVTGHANAGGFLTELAHLVLVRRLYIPDQSRLKGRSRPSLLTKRPVKVLLVVSMPHDKGPISCEPVLKLVRDLHANKDIELIPLIEAKKPDPLTEKWAATATLENFDEQVRSKQPHVIHFVGHGESRDGKSTLSFVGKGGEADPVDDDRFAKLARQSDNLKIVFLQACESALVDSGSPVAGVALSCAHQGVPAVVAMQAKIQNAAANDFACQFYQALAEEKLIDFAVKKGLDALTRIHQQNAPPLAFGVPVLYLRGHGSLMGPEKVPDRDRVNSLDYGTCPRCLMKIKRDDQRSCTQCGLGFYCKECGEKLDDPNGNFCANCEKPISKRRWPLICRECGKNNLNDASREVCAECETGILQHRRAPLSDIGFEPDSGAPTGGQVRPEASARTSTLGVTTGSI